MIESLAKLFSALAQVMWPMVAIYAIWKFGPDITSLLQRLRRGKLFGQEVELHESLTKLDQAASKMQAEATETSPKLAAATTLPALPVSKHGQNSTSEVANAAVRSPRAALMLLASKIEQRVNDHVGRTAKYFRQPAPPMAEALKELKYSESKIPGGLDAIRQFWELRNQLIHGAGVSDDDLLRAIDSGSKILRALEYVGGPRVIVIDPKVAVFADPDLERKYEGKIGVLVELQHVPDGATEIMVVPVSYSHYTVGQRITWGWLTGEKFSAAWYRDPSTGQSKLAWKDSSSTFNGTQWKDV